MVTYSQIFRLATFAFALTLAGCASQDKVISTEDSDALNEVSSVYSWTLPKTILDVSAVWTFEGCRPQEGKKGFFLPDLSVKVTVVPKAVPDRDLGKLAPTGWISLDAEGGLKSFWQDSQIQVKTFNSSHLLQALGSTSTNQAGTIVANVVTTVVKLAGVGLGVPTAAGFIPATGCDMTPTGANALYKKMLSAQEKLKTLDADSPEGKKVVSSITSIKNQLTATVSTSIDPGVDKNGNSRKVPSSGRLQAFAPSEEQLRKLNWLDSQTINEIRNNTIENPLYLSVYLNFDQANPPSVSKCANETSNCERGTTPISHGTMFREVAYIPLVIYKGLDKTAMDAKQVYTNVFPFAQFGPARALPLKAPVFGKAVWSFVFNEFGEISEANWSSAARAVGMTGAASNVANGVSSLDALKVKADQQLDNATQAQQLQNSKLKVWTDGASLKTLCETALAKGQVPTCD